MRNMIMVGKFFGLKSLFLVFTFIFGAAFSFTAFGAGELDSTFTASAYGGTNGNIFVIRQQSDGKILVGGQFTEINGFAATGIGRLNADGSVDTSFFPPDFYNGSGIGATIYAIAVQPDGKILVGGFIRGVNDAKIGIRRLNADGSLDSSFFIVEFNQAIAAWTAYDIKLQSDGKILVGGWFGFISPEDRRSLIRLNTDGTFDNTFTQPNVADIREFQILPDGKIIAVGLNNPGSGGQNQPFLRKFNADGTTDTSFTPITSGNGLIEAVKVLPNGQFLVGGSFSILNGFVQGGISRINADGTMDLNFNLNNPGANGAVKDIAVKPDGKIIIAGAFSTYNSVAKQTVTGLNQDGTPDGDFINNAIFTDTTANDVEVLADGKLIVGILFTTTSIDSLHRLNSVGTTDFSFTGKVTRIGVVSKILPQTDGKILVAGQFPFINGVARNSLARINSNGSLDTSFVPYFNDFAPTFVQALALQPDGKILIGETTLSPIVLKRLNSDGSQDTGFNALLSGSVYDIAVLPNGQILVAGILTVNSATKYIVRFNSNGTLDDNFALIPPNGPVRKIFLQPDGKVLIGGDFTQIGVSLRGRIARLTADNGALDTTFNPPGGANNTVLDFDLQTNGKIVVGGIFTALNGNSNNVRIGRLNVDGTLDTSFVQSTNGNVLGVKIQADGKILIGGSMSQVQGTPHNGIARLNANGSVDSTFNAFANTAVWDINLQSDGKILMGGEFHKINQKSAVRIARLQNNPILPKTQFDYDGDGRADVSVFRPSENRWYIFRSSDDAITQTAFAISGDQPVPADFDGDGKTDLAIFRSSGDWWSLSSSNNAQITTNLGNASDYKLPSDFDGDGRADYVIFRPSNNIWYRLSSATGMSSNLIFGLAGDKPVSGDFDGDGESDVAIYRSSTGDWWYQSSINDAQLATRWGISTDIPTPADFDGDGKTDFAVYRPSTGIWYIYNSSNGQATIMAFGLLEDKPIPADYDGDGKADIAVFRPSSGVWYLMRSTGGFTALQFGVATDIPTQNAFVP